MHPAALMSEEILISAEKAVVVALRRLKELEASHLRTSPFAPGGPHRETAMDQLRSALREVERALVYHRREAAALHHVFHRPARIQGPEASTRG